MSDGHDGAVRLAKEYPNYRNPYDNGNDWLVIVRRCYEITEKTEEFAGAWIAKDGWFPSLRTLARYGILVKLETSRGGRRAYYKMPDREGVGRALRELGYL